MTPPRSLLHLWLLLGLLCSCTGSRIPVQSAVSDRARQLHEQLLTLDTHLDTPATFANADWDIMQRHSYTEDLSQVDYPRLVAGGLDGGFWAVYTRQGPRTPQGVIQARDAALLRALRIREVVAREHAHFELAVSASDAEAIAARHKRVVYMSIENSYPLSGDVSLLDTFYALGVRMVGLVHTSNNDFADSSTDAHGKEWQGLSPLGLRLVSEANRLGMVLDASHASDDVLDQLIALSKTPIILSHSSCKAVFPHPRNVDDEHLRKLAAAGGVIQLNSLSDFLIATPELPERKAALAKLYETYGTQRDAAARLRFAQAKREIDREYPVPRASFDDYMAHVLHALSIVGPEHVGIGADWDGGGGVTGLEDVASIPKITERLLNAGYSEHDLQLIWSGNALRLLRKAEEYKQSLAATTASKGN